MHYEILPSKKKRKVTELSMYTPSMFDEQMARVQRVANTRTQQELAEFLGTPQSAVSDAKRRQKIPADWLILLLRLKSVHPEWILTGRGQQYIQKQARTYDDEHTTQRKAEQAQVLQKISSETLVEELLRRIVVAETDSFSRKGCEERSQEGALRP